MPVDGSAVGTLCFVSINPSFLASLSRECHPPTHNREPYDTLLYCPSDQVIREDPAGAVVVRAWPGHRNIGRGSCRSALADGVERRSTAVVLG